MNKLKKIMVSLMLLFTLSGQIATPVQAISEVEKTEVSSSSETKREIQNSEQNKPTKGTEESQEHPKNESVKEDNQETGESQNSNDSPELEQPKKAEKVEEKKDVNEQLTSVLKEYGYYMTTDGKFLSSTDESVRDNWSEFLGKVQALRSETQIARQTLSIVPFAGTTIYVDQNYSIPTVSWDYSNGIHEQGFYAKRDANGKLLWCVAPGNPLNFGANDGFAPEERDQQNLVIASLIAYWGYETQPSVENAFYTEHHIQNMGAGVATLNIHDTAGRVSQAGFEAWIKETNRKINSYLTKPSFDNKNYTLKKGETLRIDDTSSSLWAYTVASNDTNMNVSIDGNSLVVKATGDVKDGRISVKYNIPNSYKGATLIYRHPYSQELLDANIKDPNYAMADFKIQKEGKIKIKKVDDTNKNLEGAEFKLTVDGKTTTAKTNASGELETPNYNVGTTGTFEETKSLPGHYLDPATSKRSFTIKEGTTTIKVVNPRYANLTLIKKNDKGQNLEGVTFKLTYNEKSYTVKTDKDGKIQVLNTLKANTTVEWEEIATTAGHYIDPENSKGSIVVKSGENTLNVNNPTLNFGMTSQASNQDGAQFVNPMKGQKLRDEVMIQAHQAPANAKLRLTSDFVEFGTGEKLGEESFKQVNEFEAKQAQFVKNVYLDFDATNMHGKKGVWINVLEYYNPSTSEWEEVARHDDLNNESEAIQFVKPEIHTEFFFYDQNGNESKLTDPLKKVKGYDRVFYKNLIAGQTYTFDLTMMDRETEKEFLDPSGKPITGTITVVAGKDGEVTSTVNAREYYEQLAKEAAEKDSDKKDKDETKEADAAKETKETKETDEAKDATEGENVKDSEEQEEATEFSTLNDVELLTGHVDVPFEADLSVANGKVLVAYEQLSTNETAVAEHKDIEDEDQTGKVRNPEISTTAFVNGEKEETEDGKIIFEDVIDYKDATPGVEYEMDMTVMVKDENAPLNLQDKEVTGKAKFTPEKENGQAKVTVEFNAKDLFSKYGDSVDLVAFEKLSTNGEVIAVHEDINDEGQTVKINKPVTPVKANGRLPQTSGALGNSMIWIVLVLVLVAGAIFVYQNQKKQKQQ